MTRPFQRNCAHVFVLSMLLQLFVSHCCPEFARNTASNAVANGHVVENRSGKLDPSIERIFRGTSERRVDVTSSKRNVESKAVQHEDGDKRARLKRDSAVRGQPGNRRRSNEREEAARKRSVSDRGGKGSLRIGRSSKDLPKLPDKDYGVPVDREKSEYTDEAEDDSASGNKKARYKSNDLRASEDSAGFIDQEERSSLYDDIESKDVVKRGVSGAEDYEEVDEKDADDAAALEGNSLIQEEETQRREVHGDVRVKREHENPKGEAEEKSGNPGASGDRKTAETSSKRDTVSDKGDKAAAASGNDSNVVGKSENCSRQTVKIQNEAQALNSGIARPQDTDLSGKAPNDLAIDPSRILDGTSESERSKVADVANPEAESSRNADEDYQKRVEEQIQRKIDSIKEQIKREIEESQRLREIEENNARFDELRELEEDEDQRVASMASDNTAKRSIKRSKRHENADVSSEESRTRKRSTTKSESREADEVPRKRARQAFLVVTDRKRKRRRRRSRNSEQLVPEQRNVKLEDSLPADLSLDSRLGEALAAEKSSEEGKAVAGEDSSPGKKSGSVALLRESNEELGPLATGYGEAFGGLNGDPGMELARFKRIKRVLRSPTSKT